MGDSFTFDQAHYHALNPAREKAVRDVIAAIREECSLRTAVDVGCGIGHFSSMLRALGLEVLGLDGREGNLVEARRRHPGMEFRRFDAEDAALRDLGRFDLVFCFGLLYHLENPFAAIRNLRAMTGKVALVEGVCVPGRAASFVLRDEPATEDQGLRYVALYPTENGLVKMLYRSGFGHVYRFAIIPAHPNYAESWLQPRRRTIIVASTVELSTRFLRRAAEPVTEPDPWRVPGSGAALLKDARALPGRILRFVTKPGAEKRETLRRYWSRLADPRSKSR